MKSVLCVKVILVPDEVAFTYFTCSFFSRDIIVTFLLNRELMCRYSQLRYNSFLVGGTSIISMYFSKP